TSPPASRLAAINQLSHAGIPTGVLVAPVIPALSDHEMPAIISAAVNAGARFAGYVTLRLPYAVAPLFDQWLTQQFPDRKEKVLNGLRSLRDGQLNNAQFGSRMRGEGIFALQIESLFAVSCRKAAISENRTTLSVEHFRRPDKHQLSLFDQP